MFGAARSEQAAGDARSLEGGWHHLWAHGPRLAGGRLPAEVADDVDWAAEAASTSVPWYGSHRGKGEVPRFFKEIGSNVEVTEFSLVSLTSNDTDVVATVRWAYRVNATGKTAAMYMQHWFRFADGKIVFFRGSEDTEQSAAAFS